MNQKIATLRSAPATGESLSVGGVVRTLEDGTLVVVVDRTEFVCRRAFSCLVVPQAGDIVLIARAQAQSHYVLSIIERPSGGTVTLRVGDELMIEAAAGIGMRSAADIALQCTGSMRADTGQLEVRAREMKLDADQMSLKAETLEGQAAALTLTGGTVETLAGRIVQVSRQSFRVSETIDHLRAGQIDHESTELMRLHSRNMLISAEHLSRIDGEQIHLG
jgi:hypothetical protein